MTPLALSIFRAAGPVVIGSVTTATELFIKTSATGALVGAIVVVFSLAVSALRR